MSADSTMRIHKDHKERAERLEQESSPDGSLERIKAFVYKFEVHIRMAIANPESTSDPVIRAVADVLRESWLQDCNRERQAAGPVDEPRQD